MADSLWVVVIHAWCKICTQNCNAECSESSIECILSRGRRRLLPSQPCLPTWSGALCRGDSAANGCGQAQIFPSAQARNISTHSARRTLTFSRPVTEVLANFTLTHVHILTLFLLFWHSPLIKPQPHFLQVSVEKGKTTKSNQTWKQSGKSISLLQRDFTYIRLLL